MDKDFQTRLYAKEMVSLQELLNKESLYEWERDEIKEEYNKLNVKIAKAFIDTNLLVQYMEEYKNMTIKEYVEIYLNNN